VKHTSLTHEFTEFIPAQLREGNAVCLDSLCQPRPTFAHAGAATRVVTPISPADWQLIFDGDSVSLTPSIGNWHSPAGPTTGSGPGPCGGPDRGPRRRSPPGGAEDARDRDDYFASRSAAARLVPAAPAPAITRRRRLHPGLPHWLARRTRDRGEPAHRD